MAAPSTDKLPLARRDADGAGGIRVTCPNSKASILCLDGRCTACCGNCCQCIGLPDKGTTKTLIEFRPDCSGKCPFSQGGQGQGIQGSQGPQVFRGPAGQQGQPQSGGSPKAEGLRGSQEHAKPQGPPDLPGPPPPEDLSGPEGSSPSNQNGAAPWSQHGLDMELDIDDQGPGHHRGHEFAPVPDDYFHGGQKKSGGSQGGFPQRASFEDDGLPYGDRSRDEPIGLRYDVGSRYGDSQSRGQGRHHEESHRSSCQYQKGCKYHRDY
ncbi:uncharacterized protein E0L32_005237 [Thyridium curvatum]|uniref:Uncharacterized protein n=1 Tax=Thyridium curvatum TaxID=1093900 RepID=A0A507AUR3_9PEZI|nr:uncharacterized protein E0L32_005237 [Thyridium curvatum]TPX14545.1 hypothetical protein E0L32_005237 [Thyridium curvatum]